MQVQRFVPRKSSELASSDTRVSVVGKVISSADNGFVVDDGSGACKVDSSYPASVGDTLRVFCRVEGQGLKAEFVQSLNGVDLNLYQKVQDLYRKAGL